MDEPVVIDGNIELHLQLDLTEGRITFQQLTEQLERARVIIERLKTLGIVQEKWIVDWGGAVWVRWDAARSRLQGLVKEKNPTSITGLFAYMDDPPQELFRNIKKNMQAIIIDEGIKFYPRYFSGAMGA